MPVETLRDVHITGPRGFSRGYLNSPIRGTDASSSAGFQRRRSASSAADASPRASPTSLIPARRRVLRSGKIISRKVPTSDEIFFPRSRPRSNSLVTRDPLAARVARALDAETRAFAVSAMFPPAAHPDIIRAHQKDEVYVRVRPSPTSRDATARLVTPRLVALILSPPFPSPLPRCSATLCWTPRVASSTRAASFVTSRSSASSRSCATPRSPPAWARRPSARSTATSTKRPPTDRSPVRSVDGLSRSYRRSRPPRCAARGRARRPSRRAARTNPRRTASPRPNPRRITREPRRRRRQTRSKPPPSPGRVARACSRSCRR